MSIKEKIKWIDPFTYVDRYVMPYINPSNNDAISWAVYIIFAFVFAFVIYTVLGLILGTPTPMVIVVSESMEPELYRGDVVVLTGVTAEQLNAQLVELPERNLQGAYLSSFATLTYSISDDTSQLLKSITFSNNQEVVPNTEGDIVVYISNITGEQIIHRAVAKIRAADGYYLITKGDNSATNKTVDQDCGKVVLGRAERACITLYPVNLSELQGKAVFRVPLLGYVKLLIFDDLPNLIFGCPEGKKCYFP